MVSEPTLSVSPSLSESSNEERTTRKAWIVCLSAALFFFYEFIQMHMFNAINEALRTAFQANATQLGILSSTYLWGDVAFLLPAGILLDRFSTKTILLLSLGVCIFGTVGFAMTESFGMAAFFHALSGCGNAFCFLACVILVSRWFPPRRQAFAIGIVVTMAFLGGVMAQTPLAWLSEVVGWRMALIYDAVLGGVFFLVIARVVKDYPENYTQLSASNRSGVSLFASLKMIFANMQNVLSGIYTCLLNLPIMVLDAVWGVTYLKTVHGLSNIQASNVAAMIFFGSMIACPLMGWISDRLRLRRMPMIVGAVFSLAMACLIVFIPGWSYTELLVLFFMLGVVTSTQIITYPLAAESNDPALTGTAVGLASFIIIGGAAAAQVIFGKLLDMGWDGALANGERVYSAATYNHAMLMFPITMFVGLVAAWFLKETYCKRYHQPQKEVK